MNLRLNLLSVIFFFSFFSFLSAADYYVKVAGAGNRSGDSWENAMDTTAFANALPNAEEGATFHIAEGVYRPQIGITDTTRYQNLDLPWAPIWRDATEKVFEVRSDVNLIGGYASDAQTGDNSNSELYKTVFKTGYKMEVEKCGGIFISNKTNLTLKGLTIADSVRYGSINVYDANLDLDSCSFLENLSGSLNASSLNIEGDCVVTISSCYFYNSKIEDGDESNTLISVGYYEILKNETIKFNIQKSIFEGVGTIYLNGTNIKKIDAKIEKCKIKNCHNFIRTRDVSNFFFIDNIIEENKSYGTMSIYSSEYFVSVNILKNNTFSNNSGGLYIYKTNGTLDFFNNTMNHSYCDFTLNGSGNFNIKNNTYVDSSLGLRSNGSPIVNFTGNLMLSGVTQGFNNLVLASDGIVVKSDYNLFTKLPFLYGSASFNPSSSDIIMGADSIASILDGTYTNGIFTPNIKDNGGFTPTIALTGTNLPGCKSIKMVPTAETGVTEDQRGVERAALACVGAYENTTPAITDYYVKVAGAGDFSGRNWENAMDTIAFANALPNAECGATFHIAEGVYRPQINIESTPYFEYWLCKPLNPKAFEIRSNVTLIGGYSNNAQTVAIANSTQYQTIFKSVLENSGENYNPTLIAKDVNVNLKGLVFKEAGCNGAISVYSVKLSVDSCLFEDNLKGEIASCIYAEGGNAVLDIKNTTFKDNVCPYSTITTGWQPIQTEMNVNIENCLFENNKHSHYGVITLYNHSAYNLNINKCVFRGNNGDVFAIYNNSGIKSNVSVSNSFFTEGTINEIFASKVNFLNNTFLNYSYYLYIGSDSIAFENNTLYCKNDTSLWTNYFSNTKYISLLNNTIIYNGKKELGSILNLHSNGDSGTNIIQGNFLFQKDKLTTLINTNSNSVNFKNNIYNSSLVGFTPDDSNIKLDYNSLSSILDGTYSNGVFTPNIKDNGGFTPTIALTKTTLPNGQSIKIVPTNETGLQTDQRGVNRANPACVGAYESSCEFDPAKLTFSAKPKVCRADTVEVKLNGVETGSSFQWSCDIDSVKVINATQNPAKFEILSRRSKLPVKVKITNLCGNDTTLVDTLTVSGVRDVSFSGLVAGALYCKESAPISLVPLVAGGIFSGDGVVGNTFNPSLVTGTTATVRYAFAETDGCTSFDEKTVELSQLDQNFNLALTSWTQSNVLCHGGKANVHALITGGNGAYTYVLNNGGEHQLMGSELNLELPADNYTLQVWNSSDKCAGSVFKNFNISEPTELQANVVVKDLACSSATDGEIILTTTGGVQPYHYTLTKNEFLVASQTTSSFENLTAGTYQVKLTDANACEWTQSVEIRNLDLPELSISNLNVKNQSCYGQDNGAVTVSYTGNTKQQAVVVEVLSGTTVVKSIESVSPTNNMIGGLAVGSYNVRVRYKMSLQCMGSNALQPITILSIAPLSVAVVDSSAQTCLSSPNGSVTIKVNGWANEHTATLNTGAVVRPSSLVGQEATFNLQSLSGGDYSLRVENECGTDIAETRLVQVHGVKPYQFNIIEQKDELLCSYSEDGYVKLKITGGYVPNAIVSIQEYINGTYETLDFANTNELADSTVTFDSLPKGNYRIKYITQEPGCTDGLILAKPIYAPEALKFISDTLHVSCFGNNDGEITLLAYRGQWNKDTIVVGNNDTVPMNGFENFGYTWVKGDNPNFVFKSQQFPLEKFWTDNYGGTIVSGLVGVESLPAGKYICHVTDEKGCLFHSDSISVFNPTHDSLQVISFDIDLEKANCYTADRRLEITAKGGWGGYIYSVLSDEELNDAENGTTSNNTNSTVDIQDEEISYDKNTNIGKYKSAILLPGHYTAVVTDSLGCQAKERYDFTINPVVKITDYTKVDSVKCPGDSTGRVQLAVAGGTRPYLYKIQYDKENITESEDSVFTNLPKGTYGFYAIEYSKGCEAYHPIQIEDNKKPYVLLKNKVTDISCYSYNDGELSISLSGGTSPYVFKLAQDTEAEELPYVLSSNDYEIYSLTKGNHTLYAYDSVGCLKTLDFEIKEPEKLKINTVRATEICPGSDAGRIIVENVTGGTKPYSYSLNQSTAYVASPSLKAGIGTHIAYVKDANACVDSKEGTVRSKTNTNNIEIFPDVDFLVSTWRYASDVLAIIDISDDKTSTRDSVSFSFDNELVFKEDARYYTYGTMDDSSLIQLNVFPDSIKARIVSETTKNQITALWNQLKNVSRDNWVAADYELEKRYHEMLTIDSAMSHYKNIYPEEAISRMTFISLKNFNKDSIEGKTDSTLIQHSIKMTVYYADGCDYQVEKVLKIAPDDVIIYPNGDLNKKYKDISKLLFSPNPLVGNENYQLDIEFFNKVDFTVAVFNILGEKLVDKDFSSDKINSEMKAVITKSNLGGFDFISTAVVRVSTKSDAESLILIIKN